MLDKAVLFIPEKCVPGEHVSLCKPISAVQLALMADGSAKLVGLVQLSPGVEVEICGDGFNERTIKVHANGQHYFVFRQDFESQQARRS
jgi:hypothetical protein